MIAFVIWTIVSLIFAGIGISARKSKEVIGFFTGVKPPSVRDISKYNHAVSTLWLLSAILLELMGIPFLFAEQNSPAFISVFFGVIILVLGMMITYRMIEKKYKA